MGCKVVAYLRSDASDTFTTLTGTTLNVTGTINGGDLRGEAWQMGRDTNDCISTLVQQLVDFTLDNNLDMRGLKTMATCTLMATWLLTLQLLQMNV